MTVSPPTVRARFVAWRGNFLPYALLMTSALIWAGNWVIGRAIRDAVPPVALTFWRWAVAALLLAPFALPRLKGKGALLRRNWHVLLIIAGSGIALFQLFIYVGLTYTTVINGVLMNAALPLFMMLIAWAIDGHRVSARQLLGMIFSFCGIVVIVTHGEIAGLRDVRFNPGDVLILLAMPTWGVYSVMLRRRPAGVDGLAFIFVAAALGAVLLAPLYLWESLYARPIALTWESAGAVLYVAVFASIVAYICWNRGVDLIGPNKAGFTAHLLPAFGTLLALTFLGEEVRLFHAAGIAVILSGVWLATSARNARPHGKRLPREPGSLSLGLLLRSKLGRNRSATAAQHSPSDERSAQDRRGSGLGNG